MNTKQLHPSYGVIFYPFFPPETLADFARQAEAAGFDELWLWDDCFTAGALTSATIALAATQRLKVGIGLMPATVYNPLFAAMEITTLSRAFPQRFMPGFGYGVPAWMGRIGARPKSFLQALEETVTAVGRLLRGEQVTLHGTQVHLDEAQMWMTPDEPPPLYIGGMRTKTLQLAGRAADGVILTSMSSPGYVRWARQQVEIGMAQVGRKTSRLVVFVDVKVNPDGEMARAKTRRALAEWLPWEDVLLREAGIEAEVQRFIDENGAEAVTEGMPDAWLDVLAAAGTPEQVSEALQRLVEAGADALVFQPLNGDPDCLDEYARYLMPVIGKR